MQLTLISSPKFIQFPQPDKNSHFTYKLHGCTKIIAGVERHNTNDQHCQFFLGSTGLIFWSC